MCGITGYISENIGINELKDSIDSLKHRGPNNQSSWSEDNIGLGHTRLSIIDLSEDANQPMHSRSGRYIMVYNGEIYNFKALATKHKLETNTSSDSEVILELFEKNGSDFVNDLNGMFAIAIYDKKTKELHLFRDRVGIKPLFYYYNGNDFIFASELKALLQYSIVGLNKELNKEVVYQFLQYGYIHEPVTIFKDIYKFPSGNYAKYSNKELSLRSYWQVNDKIKTETLSNEKDAVEKLESALRSSVERRMISDVPLGTFLSGGIDSSLVTAIAQSISDQPVNTFSIGFKESKFDESKFASNVSKKLSTNHHEFIVSENDVLEYVDEYFNTYDEPYADSSGFPTMLVSKLAKEHVSVILSGDGGDELFHGYGMYDWADRLNTTFSKTFRKPIGCCLSKMSNRYKRAAELFKYKSYSRIKSHIFSQEQYYFSEKELSKLLVDNKAAFINEEINSLRILSPREEQSVFDLMFYLKDDLLVKVDRASMLSALEVRVPLLDHEVVEFALNLNENLKIKNGEKKYILKQVLYKYLPEELFNRPKWGFSIPLEKWLKTDLDFLLNNYTSKEIIEKFNIVNFDYVNKLKNDYLNGKTYLYNRLWLIVVLHKNLEKYFNE